MNISLGNANRLLRPGSNVYFPPRFQSDGSVDYYSETLSFESFKQLIREKATTWLNGYLNFYSIGNSNDSLADKRKAIKNHMKCSELAPVANAVPEEVLS